MTVDVYRTIESSLIAYSHRAYCS